MAWSRLSNQQRARLALGGRDFVRASFQADTDAYYAQKRAQRETNAAALSAFTPEEISGLADKLPAGRAKGCDELNRPRAKAMPMHHSHLRG
jgi:hypothetical protein